nr:nucleoprotein [Novirhabdovirus hirame]
MADLKEEFAGLRGVKGGALEDSGTEYDPTKINLTLYGTDKLYTLAIIKRAVSQVGGSQTNKALGILCAFVTSENNPDMADAAVKLLVDMKFKVDVVPVDDRLNDNLDDPNSKLAEVLTEENMVDLVKGLLFTCALMVKYDVDKMATYCQQKLERLANSQGLNELTLISTSRAVLARIGAAVRPGQKLTKAIYGIILINLMDPATAARAKALCAMRLSGTGMTMVGLFNQASKNLGAPPADLLEDLCMKSIIDSARRIVKLMRIVADAEDMTAKYAIMMSRMLGDGYFKSYGINENSRITCILMNINEQYDEGTTGGLAGVRVSPPFRKLATEIARLLVKKYDGNGSAGPGASDLVRQAEQVAQETEGKDDKYDEEGEKYGEEGEGGEDEEYY